MTTADGLSSEPERKSDDGLAHTLVFSDLDVRGREKWTVTDVSGKNAREGKSKQIALLSHEHGDTIQVFVGTEEGSNVAEWYSVEWYRDDETHELTEDHDTSESAETQIRGIMLAVAERERGRKQGKEAAFERLKSKLASVMLEDEADSVESLF